VTWSVEYMSTRPTRFADSLLGTRFIFSFDLNAINAIVREKELKKWRREWKINLIKQSNPEWVDLYSGIAN
jgi:predicted GIY-YIG superfamily endonuclease